MAQENPPPKSDEKTPDAQDVPDSPPAEMAEQALDDAQGAVQAIRDETDSTEGASNFQLPGFEDGQGRIDDQASGLTMLNDVSLKVKIELGRTHMYVEDVLRLNPDAVIELDKAAGDPVDIFVNDRLVARGEVLVLNENFCVRVGEIIDQVKADAL